MREALELISLVQNITSATSARVRSGTVSVEAWLIARRFALVSGGSHGVARLAGTCFRSGADAVEATIRTDWLASLVSPFVPWTTLANPRSNTVSSSATSVTLRYAKPILIRGVTILADASIHRHAPSNSTTSLTSGNAELSAPIQLVPILADALPQVQITNSVVTSNRAGWDALALVVLDKVRVAAAGIRANAESVETGLFAYRITLAEVVDVTFVTLAANLDTAQGRIGSVTGRDESVVGTNQADRWDFLEADSGWDGTFGFVQESVQRT